MGETQGRLTVFFEEPFWVGMFERWEGGKLSVAKVTFGAEPKDYEVYEFIMKHYFGLRFSLAVEADTKTVKRNQKQRQRDIRKALENVGTGTKAQRAWKLQQEQNKQERRVKRRADKLAEAKRMFAQKQQKKKEKHRGR